MANTHRYLYGDQDIVYLTPTTTAIEIGDFVAIDSDLLIPVSAIADAGDAAANREAAADKFAGIAMAASSATETDPIPVAQAGVWRLTQKAAAAIHQGDPIGIYASADACEDQTVVEDSTSPIATCVTTKGATGTDVEAKLLPSKLFGTPQG